MVSSTLKAKATRKLNCEVCGCVVKRNKTFSTKVASNDIESAKSILASECRSWSLTEKQKHCGVCWSIVRSM